MEKQPVGRDPGDVADFIKHLKSNGKPALAALIGNAYRWQISELDVAFFLDHSHANLIPMLKMPRNQEQLDTVLTDYFGKKFEIGFRIGKDPKAQSARQKEAQALKDVKANPKVKFVLEKFNGTIMQCQILEKEQS